MNDQLEYLNIDQLRALSLDELRALWELVPTDRQKAYKAAYEREVQLAGASGSDALERQVNSELIRRYSDGALIPLGSHWVRTPTRVQEAAQGGEALDKGEDNLRTGRRPSPQVILAIMGCVGVFLAVMVFRGAGANDDADLVASPTETYTPTPEVSPTPTPLALEAQDAIIQGGDEGREIAYPVTLQVDTQDGTPPKVWVVQRRAIQASEWRFDSNPDTASFIAGMSVRPVIGVPWSDENREWFKRMRDGTVFTLQMNTGAILRFKFVSKTEVRRSDTAIFRQISPGLALLLIGETDEDGLPTATRTLITAAYPPEQELGRDGELVALSLPTLLPTPTPHMLPTLENAKYAGVHVDLISVNYGESTVATRLRIFNGGTNSLSISPDDIWIAFGYAPNPPGPRNPAENVQPFDLAAQQAADITAEWQWAGEPYGAFFVMGHLFDFQLSPGQIR